MGHTREVKSLGHPPVVENATGNACEQDVDYYPYGGEQNDYCSTPVSQHYKFTGKERDTESGLDNFGARYDSSSLGRFMTPDWAAKPVTVPYAKFGDPQTLNLYAYVENGPINKVDADGHILLASYNATANAEYTEEADGTIADVNQQHPQPAQTTQTQQSQPDQAQNTNTQQVGNVVHNETGGLRPEAKEGSGSSQDLHNAKVAVADVVENREKAGNNGGVASDKVSSKERNTPQYKDAQQAAAEAARSDVTGGSKHFYLDYGQKPPSWAAGKETTTYGPFKNAAGGGDVPKGADVKIIIVHPENQQ